MPRGRGILRVGKRFRIRWLDAYGERKSETYASESAARAALRARQVEADKVRAGLARPRSELRLAAAAPGWLKIRPRARHRDDESVLRVHVLPFLGTYRLAEIRPAVLERFVRHLEEKRSARPGQRTLEFLRPKTVKTVLITLCKMLGDLGFPQRVKYKVPTSGYAWIPEEADVGRFLDECKPDWFRAAAALAVYAGPRKGEVAGLRRDALDFERGLIRVDRSYEGSTKSRRVRWVPLSPEPGAHPPPLAPRPPGGARGHARGRLTPYRASGAPRSGRRACRRAGIEEVNFHQLRHTAASHLATKVPLPIVGAVLGHASPQTTARYAHLDTEGLARDPRLHLSFAATKAPWSRFRAPMDRPWTRRL